MQTGVDAALAATNGAVRPIESWSGAATIDQRRQIDFAMEGGTKAIADLNRAIQVEIPAMYTAVAKKAWPKPVAAVPVAKNK